MSDLYTTIDSPSEASCTVRRSRFLAYAFPVTTPAEARARVDEIAKRYYDARHVCWAYMLGWKREQFRANDNGEPSGTAGKPILGQINSRSLTDVLVVVVRYFGGIKLGTSGLIAAYREAASEALDAAVKVERHVTARLSFTYPYEAVDAVMKLSRLKGVKVLRSVMDNSCAMTLEVNLDDEAAVRQRLENIDGATMVPDSDGCDDTNQ